MNYFGEEKRRRFARPKLAPYQVVIVPIYEKNDVCISTITIEDYFSILNRHPNGVSISWP